jgi:hypothetical protein
MDPGGAMAGKSEARLPGAPQIPSPMQNIETTRPSDFVAVRPGFTALYSNWKQSAIILGMFPS